MTRVAAHVPAARTAQAEGRRAAAPHAPRVEAFLRLVFRARGDRTYLAEQHARAPLAIIRPFSQTDGSALLQIVHVAPGLMGGDEYRLDVTVESGAQVILTGTSAMKLYPARPAVGGEAPGDPVSDRTGGPALRRTAGAFQHATFTVMDGGALEYYPGLTIPFAGAEFTQTVDVTLAPSAKFGMLEQWAMGRIERGEYLAFRRLSGRTRIIRGGAPCYYDALEFRPGDVSLAGWGMLEGHRYLASGYWYWDAAEPQRDLVEPGLLLVSGVPPHGHRYLRCLAQDGTAMRRALRDFLAAQRTAWRLAPLPFERYTAL